MANDRKQFERALTNWRGLKSEKRLSLPPDIGRTAIVCSYNTTYEINDGTLKPHPKDIGRFRKEAFALAELLETNGATTEVVLNARRADMTSILMDESISSVITIGHGSLSAVQLSDGDYCWLDVVRDANHLKTGDFVQRQCGGYSRNISVPLGFFAVSDPENVIAAPGIGFEPRGLYHSANQFLTRVLKDVDITYDNLKAHLSYKYRADPMDSQPS